VTPKQRIQGSRDLLDTRSRDDANVEYGQLFCSRGLKSNPISVRGSNPHSKSPVSIPDPERHVLRSRTPGIARLAAAVSDLHYDCIIVVTPKFAIKYLIGGIDNPLIL
jgi:hypothetical protein